MGPELNIVVIGSGMYVCGRGTDGYGTVMPAILTWTKKGLPASVWMSGSDPSGMRKSRAKVNGLLRTMGTSAKINYIPLSGRKDSEGYKKVINKVRKPACAIVVVPDKLHKKVALDCIKAGLHTLVVKPLVERSNDALQLLGAQKKNGVYCAVEFHKRLDRANMLLRDTVQQGKIGDPLYFLVEYSQRKDVPFRHFKKWAKDTNIFQYLGVHYVDIIHFVTGAVPVRAMGIGQKGWLKDNGIDTYDSVQAVIEWKTSFGKRFSSVIAVNWIDPSSTSAMSDQKIKVIGTKGRFESDQKKRGITIVSDACGMEEPNPYFCLSYGRTGESEYHGYGIDSICQFLDDVNGLENGVKKIKDLEACRPTFRQSLASTMALEAVNSSLRRNGEWVNVKGSDRL